MKKVAVIDGFGEHAEVYLYQEDENGEVGDDGGCIEWPDGWPERVSREFLERQGYEVRTA